MYQVEADHQVVSLNVNSMTVLDKAGNTLATAEREHDQAPWIIKAPNVDDATATTRAEAVGALSQKVYESLGPNDNDEIPGDGYSMMVPPGLMEMA